MKNISKNDIIAVSGFYLFFSWLYNIVLWYSGYGFREDGFWGWIDLESYWFRSGMQYVFYLIGSIFIWYVSEKIIKFRRNLYKVLFVAFIIPIVVFVFREIRYEYIDHLGIGRLREAGTIWDWYIPSLFLWIQFGCLFAYRYFEENKEKLKVEGELKNAALKSELSAIKAQLNPHFLYNIFNTISASVPPENEKTRHLIAELSDLFRYQLKASQVEKVPLREELSFVEKYLELEKERFKERLEVEMDVDNDIMDEMVPPMLLQPLVENSIKHGLSSLLEGGKISIRIKRKEGKLAFEITDTGVGVKDVDQLFGTGVGLTNTKFRLEKMYQSTLKVSDNSPHGLKLNFSI